MFYLDEPILKKNKIVSINNLHSPEDYIFVHELNNFTSPKTDLLIITESDDSAKEIASEIKTFTHNVYHLPCDDTLPYDSESKNKSVLFQQIQVLNQFIHSNKKKTVVTSFANLLEKFNKENYQKDYFSIHVDKSLNIKKFRSFCTQNGYQEKYIVDDGGFFSIKNNIIDITIPDSKGIKGYRIRLNNNKVKSINCYDLISQLSIKQSEPINQLDIHFILKDNTLETNTDHIIDFLSKRCYVLIYNSVKAAFNKYQNLIQERYQDSLTYNPKATISPSQKWFSKRKIISKLENLNQIYINTEKSFSEKKIIATIPLNSKECVLNAKTVKDLVSIIKSLPKSARLIISAQSVERTNDFKQVCMLTNKSVIVTEHWNEDIIRSTDITILTKSTTKSFFSNNIYFLNEKSIFDFIIDSETEEFQHIENSMELLNNIQKGDYLVHLYYGVCQYDGITNINGQEMIAVYFKESKSIFPIQEIDKISPYISTDSENVQLDLYKGGHWIKAITNSIDEIKSTAGRLLKIQAEKKAKKGLKCIFSKKSYTRFVKYFPFKESPDQIKTTSEIIKDLTSNKVMDRIVCGDVGFGKTEVAMRATFIAAESGYQVFIVVPITTLANQHFRSFKDRFKHFNFEIEVLFDSNNKDNKTVVKSINEGKGQIVIGTHSLLQKKIKPTNLGLVIIDEEHRFGALQKNIFSELRSKVNILSMTATPIPRTLSMSMHKLRDISIIATPPLKRLPIKTFALVKTTHTIKEAISRETNRGGQVFYLHNNIATIDECKEKLSTLFPSLRIKVGHGQMDKTDLQLTMQQFYQAEFDVFVCTTVIETGIDVPNANTIIIENADKLGISQLHQLRGRTGRSTRQAFAYLLFSANKQISQSAKKRLNALVQHSALGEGYMLSNHDLEIRGAGDILGVAQSGKSKIHKIGYNLYMRLLERAIMLLENNKEISNIESIENLTDIDLNQDSRIKNDYINDDSMRLSFYKRISLAKDESSMEKISGELTDRFGNIPAETYNLLMQHYIKNIYQPLGVSKIVADEENGYITFHESNIADFNNYMEFFEKNSVDYSFRNNSLHFQHSMKNKQGLYAFLIKLIQYKAHS